MQVKNDLLYLDPPLMVGLRWERIGTLGDAQSCAGHENGALIANIHMRSKQGFLEVSMEPKVVKDLKDLCGLFLLKKTKGSTELQCLLERRARKVVRFWMQFLKAGNSVGRPRDQGERAKWRTVAQLKMAGVPTRRVFSILRRHGYTESDIDRLRKGVERIEKETLAESQRDSQP